MNQNDYVCCGTHGWPWVFTAQTDPGHCQAGWVRAGFLPTFSMKDYGPQWPGQHLALPPAGFRSAKRPCLILNGRSPVLSPGPASAPSTRGACGRSQDIPVAMLNGVYSTLNQLTSSNNFRRWPIIHPIPANDYHDTKNGDHHAVDQYRSSAQPPVSGEMINARRADLDVLPSPSWFAADRQAYYQYLQAGKAVEITPMPWDW